MSSTFTTLEAEFDVYRLSVVGDDDLWFWCVSLDDDDLTEGTERTLGAAMAAAKAAALQHPQPCPCCAH
jgi:hypothetical protein